MAEEKKQPDNLYHLWWNNHETVTDWMRQRDPTLGKAQSVVEAYVFVRGLYADEAKVSPWLWHMFRDRGFLWGVLRQAGYFAKIKKKGRHRTKMWDQYRQAVSNFDCSFLNRHAPSRPDICNKVRCRLQRVTGKPIL